MMLRKSKQELEQFSRLAVPQTHEKNAIGKLRGENPHSASPSELKRIDGDDVNFIGAVSLRTHVKIQNDRWTFHECFCRIHGIYFSDEKEELKRKLSVRSFV
ncbi:hypothetical protein GCK32_016486 [Trichostrongylus colubriformis]|uniref:Uncharacterized protein n=1 Tax=Trichostrongylus colubriformis TaxID=6319 RepID=A0AAN8G9L2_TRICO